MLPADLNSAAAIVDDDLPPVLFQYTRWAGVESMLKSGEIWATHFHALNDREEVEYAKGLLRSMARVNSEWTKHVDDLIHAAEERPDVFVASLTEEGDLLSQWRGYAEDGAGYCVGFDTSNLRYAVKAVSADEDHPKPGEGWDLRQVIYAPGAQINLLLPFLTGGTPAEFARIAPTLKAPHWNEEREWRLVYRPGPREKLGVRALGSAKEVYKPLAWRGWAATDEREGRWRRNASAGNLANGLVCITLGPKAAGEVERVERVTQTMTGEKLAIFSSRGTLK